MSVRDPAARAEEETAVIDAVREGDEAAFATAAEPYRRQLLVDCYRMVGSDISVRHPVARRIGPAADPPTAADTDPRTM